jgi:hypothetical protein
MDDVSSRPPRRAFWLVFEVALGAAAAAPSVIGGLLGSPLALDDWGFAALSRYVGFTSGFGRQSRSRPIEGIWNWAEFRILGTHPLPHLLVLAAVNVAVAILFWRLLERWLPRRVAILSAVAWVVLSNRGSTHLWSTNSPHVFSLVMLLAALVVASGRPLTGTRFGTALALFFVGTLAYEGAIALGVVGLVAVIWTQAPRRVRVRWAVVTVGVMGAVGGWVLLSSPKRGASPPPFRNLSHLASAHFGDAVLPGPSRLVALIVLVAIAWCLVTVALPGFEPRLEQKLVVLGLGVLVLGAAPFAVAGFPFSSSGFFDRGNLFADLGTAVVYGSLVALLLRVRWPAVGVTCAALALVGLAVPNVKSVRNYALAGRDGRRFLAAIDALPVDVRTRGPVTFLPLPSHGGVSEFLANYDISAALALRYHTGARFPRAAMAVSATGFKNAEGPTYELVGRRLVQR